jgi:hypothetical protein
MPLGLSPPCSFKTSSGRTRLLRGPLHSIRAAATCAGPLHWPKPRQVDSDEILQHRSSLILPRPRPTESRQSPSHVRVTSEPRANEHDCKALYRIHLHSTASRARSFGYDQVYSFGLSRSKCSPVVLDQTWSPLERCCCYLQPLSLLPRLLVLLSAASAVAVVAAAADAAAAAPYCRSWEPTPPTPASHWHSLAAEPRRGLVGGQPALPGPWAGRYAGRRGQSPAFAQAGLLKLQVSGQYPPSSESLAQAGFPSSESGKAQYRDGGCRPRRAATAAGEALCPPPCWPPLGGIAQPSHLISLRPDPSESSILSPHHL